jgi:hypothetical protein
MWLLIQAKEESGRENFVETVKRRRSPSPRAASVITVAKEEGV